MSELLGDYSSMYNTVSNDVSSNYHEAGFMGRNWLGQLLGFGGASEMEDWELGEQSSNNAFYRDMLRLNEENSFNAREAQKNRDFQERMSNSAYQRAVKDMKLAGLNPSLMYSSGGMSTPSGSFASSGSSSSSGRGGPSRRDSGLANVAQIVAGLISRSATITAAGISAASKSNNHKRSK